jgi:hypothetical protein
MTRKQFEQRVLKSAKRRGLKVAPDKRVVIKLVSAIRQALAQTNTQLQPFLDLKKGFNTDAYEQDLSRLLRAYLSLRNLTQRLKPLGIALAVDVDGKALEQLYRAFKRVKQMPNGTDKKRAMITLIQYGSKVNRHLTKITLALPNVLNR